MPIYMGVFIPDNMCCSQFPIAFPSGRYAVIHGTSGTVPFLIQGLRHELNQVCNNVPDIDSHGANITLLTPSAWLEDRGDQLARQALLEFTGSSALSRNIHSFIFE